MLLRRVAPEAKIASSKIGSYFCTDPKDGEEVLEAEQPAPVGYGQVAPGADAGGTRADDSKITSGQSVSAAQAAPLDPQPAIFKDPTDEIAAARAAALAQAYRGSLAPIRRIIAESASREQAIEAVRSWYADWNDARAAQVVEEALQIAAAAGAQAQR